MPQNLRILAVAAPENEVGGIKDSRVYSADPASMFNAMRYAALKASDPERFAESAWAQSNLTGSRKDRRDKCLLMSSLDDMPTFEEKLKKEKPNVLFLGSMSLCLPGAIACAQKAREILGEEVLIVLGGYHANETMYQFDSNLVQIGGDGQKNKTVIHHEGSPLKLMKEGKIPPAVVKGKALPLFDMVISGHAEHIVAEIGEAAAKALTEKGSVREAFTYLEHIDRQTPGDWTMGYLQNNKMKTIMGDGVGIDYNQMPSSVSMFGANAYFGVFQNNPQKPTPTAHIFSDTGGGCVYSCNFCSEGREVRGALSDFNNASQRLFQQLKDAHDVIKADHPGCSASAFCEDSVFLGASSKQIEKLCEKLEKNPLDIKFGAQFTVDQVAAFAKSGLLRRLKHVGMDYVFVGIETLNPQEIDGGMHKDIKGKKVAWEQRVKTALYALDKEQIKSGAAILFRLGEPHNSRLELLDKIDQWRKISPKVLRPISMNWAVLHPLRNPESDTQYDYLKWGTSKHSPLMALSHEFGEFSERYFMPAAGAPKLNEVREIVDKMKAMNAKDDLTKHVGRFVQIGNSEMRR